jgi:hypothetical protein
LNPERIYRDPTTDRILVERRSDIDRRKQAFSLLFSHRFRRRRSKGRRKTDKGGYIDIYDSRSLIIAFIILILSLLDAALTGIHVLRGSASELNPILKVVLSRGGISAFFSIKAAMTILPLMIIMIHKEWLLGKFAAKMCLWSYVLVSLYHLYLIAGLHRLGFLHAWV